MTLTHDSNKMKDKPRKEKRSLFQFNGQHEQHIDQNADSGKDAQNDDYE